MEILENFLPSRKSMCRENLAFICPTERRETISIDWILSSISPRWFEKRLQSPSGGGKSFSFIVWSFLHYSSMKTIQRDKCRKSLLKVHCFFFTLSENLQLKEESHPSATLKRERDAIGWPSSSDLSSCLCCQESSLTKWIDSIGGQRLEKKILRPVDEKKREFNECHSCVLPHRLEWRISPFFFKDFLFQRLTHFLVRSLPRGQLFAVLSPSDILVIDCVFFFPLCWRQCTRPYDSNIHMFNCFHLFWHRPSVTFDVFMESLWYFSYWFRSFEICRIVIVLLGMRNPKNPPFPPCMRIWLLSICLSRFSLLSLFCFDIHSRTRRTNERDLWYSVPWLSLRHI